MPDQKSMMVFYDSPEAAELKTITGWVSRTGFYFGDDEHTARISGRTHKKCECGEVIESRSYCDKCAENEHRKNYQAMPAMDWDGKTPITLNGADEYFFDADRLADYCEENDCSSKDLELVICEPVFMREIDAYDYCGDDLPEDGFLPSDIDEALKALNEVIKNCKKPICWKPGKFKVSPDSISIDVA